MSTIKCSTAGFAMRGSTDAKLTVSTNIIRCGHIEDGIALEHGNRGGWVISFKDLQKIYKSACHERGIRP